MKRLRVCWMVVLVAACVAGWSSRAAAEDDPPGRIARLSYMSGDVSMQPGGVDNWVKADLNRPLTKADRLWTAAHARAEMHIGSTAMRLSGETSLTLANLDDYTVRLQLAQGTLQLNVRQIYENETYEVDTPNGSFTIARAGDYRFDVDSEGDVSTAMVRSGELQAWQGSQSVTLGAGRLGTFRGANFAYDIGSAPGEDEFDRWCENRDQRENRAVAARYVSPYMTGYEDLDGYGSWRTVEPYGVIWVPAVSVGWAPYRYGHWVWISPWGWTWVDDAPWGFAPFHYGRWVHYGGYWGWCPGPRILRPVYAPALVAWIGGSHFGIGISFGYSSWVPLGWGEVYAPWYRSSPRYWRNVNRTTVINNTTIINNTYNYYNGNRREHPPFKYANYRVAGGLTAAPQSALLRSERIDRVAIRVPEGNRKNPDPVMAPRLTPTRETMTGARPAAMRPPARVLDRPMVARNAADKQRPERQLNPAAERLQPGNATRQSADKQRPERQLNPAAERLRPGNVARPVEQAARPGDNAQRRTVPRPPDAQANDFRRVPMPANNGVLRQEEVRHEVPRPAQSESASRRVPNEENARVPRPMDDGEARPNVTPRQEVPRPAEMTGSGRESTPQARREVPRPQGNGSGSAAGKSSAGPQYSAPQSPRYEAPRATTQAERSDAGRPTWRQQGAAPQSRPQVSSRPSAPQQRQAAPERRSAPQHAPTAKRDSNDRGRKP